MANVTYEKTSPVTGRLQLSFTKDEISRKLDEALKKEKKRVSIRGFRKGKTPLSALRKLMGNQLLGPILDENIQNELFGYIEENDIKLIFTPVPDESEPVDTISASNIRDLNLTYDLGLEPEFELQMPEQTFTKYVLNTDEAFLDERVQQIRKQLGETKQVEDGKIEKEDIIEVTFQEVDGEINNTAKLYVDNLTEEAQEMFVGKEVGFTTTVTDLTTLEENATSKHVNKYLLELEDEEADLSGKSFTLTVDEISRLVPAELDEEFFTKFDPQGKVTSEEEMRQSLAENNAAGFNGQGVSMANFEIQRALVEGNQFDLPLDLMRKISQGDSDKQFELFERSVRWMLIRNKVAEQHEIELEYEDIREEASSKLIGMLGGQRPDFLTDEFLDNYIQNMLKDEKQREELSNAAMENKVMDVIREQVTLVEQPLSVDEFNETIKKFNEENAPVQEEE